MRALSYFLAAAAGAVAAAVALSFFPLGHGAPAATAIDTKSIESTIESYLGNHPEVVAKALEHYQSDQKMAARDTTRSLIRAKSDEVFHDPADQVLGDPKGDVTVVEFFDYRCPYCKRVTASLMDAVKADGHIRLVLKEFPILGPNSTLATRAAIASVKQGKYAAFHVALLTSPAALDESSIMAIATATGLDTTRLAADMKDPAIDSIVEKNYALAQALRIDGTPAFIIGDELVPGALDRAELENLVKEARSKG